MSIKYLIIDTLAGICEKDSLWLSSVFLNFGDSDGMQSRDLSVGELYQVYDGCVFTIPRLK